MMIYHSNVLLSIFLIIFIDLHSNLINCNPALTENQIKEDIKFLSQTGDGIKPSRLRALLLADLKKALTATQFLPEIDCFADADLKVNTLNCTCTNYSCSSRSFNHAKRSRIIITKSCEEFCCRRRTIVKKSISPSSVGATLTLNRKTERHQCEIANFDETKPNEVRIKSLVQIYSVKSKQPICIGSLIHPKIVMTTLVCATIQMNDRLYVKIKETVDKYQNLYQIRNVTKKIMPNNFAESFEKYGFNVALLILDHEVNLNNEIETTCLARIAQPIQSNNLMYGHKCFVTSLENINGRIMEKTESVNIFDAEKCRETYTHQHRQQMFFPKANICAGRTNFENIKIKTNGAPLICLHEQTTGQGRHYYYYVQYGMLAWSTDKNKSPHLFTNISNYRFWLEKNLKELFEIN